MGLRADAYDCQVATFFVKSHDLPAGVTPTYAGLFCTWKPEREPMPYWFRYLWLNKAATWNPRIF